MLSPIKIQFPAPILILFPIPKKKTPPVRLFSLPIPCERNKCTPTRVTPDINRNPFIHALRRHLFLPNFVSLSPVIE